MVFCKALIYFVLVSGISMFLSTVLSEFLVSNLSLEAFMLYMDNPESMDNPIEETTEISYQSVQAKFEHIRNESHVQNLNREKGDLETRLQLLDQEIHTRQEQGESRLQESAQVVSAFKKVTESRLQEIQQKIIIAKVQAAKTQQEVNSLQDKIHEDTERPKK